MDEVNSQTPPRLRWEDRLLMELEDKCASYIGADGTFGTELPEDGWPEGYDPQVIHSKAVEIINRVVPSLVELESYHHFFDDAIIDWSEVLIDAVAQLKRDLTKKADDERARITAEIYAKAAEGGA